MLPVWKGFAFFVSWAYCFVPFELPPCPSNSAAGIESLHVSSTEPIHIQQFCRVLSLQNLQQEYANDGPAFRKIDKALGLLLDRVPNRHSLRCRACENGTAWRSVVSISKFQATLTKTLQSALEASLKHRLWCDVCQGYRDFSMSRQEVEAIGDVVFIVDDALYRSFHVLEEMLTFNKDQCQLHLKAILAESHCQEGTNPVDLKAAIRKDGEWIRCQDEFVGLEPLDLAKLRPIVLLFDREVALAKGCIRLDQKLAPLAARQIAIDAEYVFYDRAQIEFHSDGSQRIVKPKKTRLARLSLVDVNGDGTILDEYVRLEDDEVIVDYCTHISGISERDLLPGASPYSLCDRKLLLMKLQSLIDAGCIFIGHGLMNDFRVFNVSIDSSQLLDTVKLFHLPGNRSLSLKFLTWYFFKESIQVEEHDSVIDALTAARLYRKYQEIAATGPARLQETLQDLYAVGAVMEWQPPPPSNKIVG